MLQAFLAKEDAGDDSTRFAAVLDRTGDEIAGRGLVLPAEPANWKGIGRWVDSVPKHALFLLMAGRDADNRLRTELLPCRALRKLEPLYERHWDRDPYEIEAGEDEASCRSSLTREFV